MANFTQNLALKYRPKQFLDLAGQEYVAKVLKNITLSGDIRNAYLLFGSRGTGKTSASRIFAKAINCLDSKDGEPCNKCTSCVGIDSGNSVDVQELDCASFGLVEHMRSLKESVQYQNLISKYKVIVLDEAQSMSKEGGGALLKILEETPKNVVFVLITTEFDKILETITSRCINLNFGKVSNANILSRLSQICEKEGISCEKGVLELISKKSEGSLRDAVMSLEQMVLYTDEGNPLNLSKLKEILGILQDSVFEDLLNSLKNKDLEGIVRILLKIEQKNISYMWFLEHLTYFFRNILLAKHKLMVQSGIDISVFVSVWDEKELISMIDGIYVLMDRLSRFPFAQRTLVNNHFLALLYR